MKLLLPKRMLALITLCGAMTHVAWAAPSATKTPAKSAEKTPAKSAAPTCPKCKMALATKADKTHTVAVKIKDKTYYCCSGCGAHKAAKTPAKTTAKDDKKQPAKAPMCPKCNMQMNLTKSPLKATPMKVNGKTYYCCSICPKH